MHPLVHRRDRDPAAAGTARSLLFAVGALQRALLALVEAFDAAHPGLTIGLLSSDRAPRSPEAWDEALRRQLVGTPVPAGPMGFVVASQEHNPALATLRDRLQPVGLGESLAGLLHRAAQSPQLAGRTLADALLEPARLHPDDLWAQLTFLLDAWEAYLPDAVRLAILRAQDVRTEETTFRGHGPGPGPVEAADFSGGGPPPGPAGLAEDDATVRFSDDQAWMKRLVMIAKHTYVWLDQLSKRTGRRITRLDEIPDEELASLAEAGITGVWLIGLWERSPASQEIKRRMGNAEALASAYSIDTYGVAWALGGEDALEGLKARAARHGIRIGADMVPNHTSLDSRDVVEHPDRFLQVSEPPFPGYRFTGPDLSQDSRVQVRLEDGYWDHSDAAVVYQLVHNDTGRVRYVYHGNDGTVMPWNDTAQLDFSKAETREAVLGALVAVARRFPILRLDAAMVLARRHVQRLWFPPPGEGGAIPSRAERGMTAAEFQQAVPREFWVEAVERIRAEAPDTLLLAEAFWMMEEYFVRSLGMHRVYHSAFMHMLRDGDNAGFRKILKDLLAYSPAVLERYANFLSNPDEETAAQQFGTMDRYFTAATLQATLPGLPMLGHGQLEGSREKYGMEAARAHSNETLDQGLLDHHRQVLFPLLRERDRFASTERFHLFDHVGFHGGVNDNVYAFSNVDHQGRRSVVLVHHGDGHVTGSIRQGCPRNEGAIDAPHLVSRSLADALGLAVADDRYVGVFEQRAQAWRLVPSRRLADSGLAFDLGAYETRVFTEFREMVDVDGRIAAVCEELGGAPVSDLDALLSPPEASSNAYGLPVRATDPSRAVPGGLAPATPPAGAGLLLHPSSLPGPEGIGTLGAEARALAAWAGKAGLSYWQVLPLCEGGPGDSPYSSPSSLVGSPWLIDLRDLVAEGLLTAEEASSVSTSGGAKVDFAGVRAEKEPLLRVAARRLLGDAAHPLHGAWLDWRARHAWIEDFALFGELLSAHGGSPWWEWAPALRDREPAALEQARSAHAAGAEERAVLAFLFDHQWAALLDEAEKHGVTLIGDLPIYVSRDSADAWVDRQWFEFDDAGLPDRVAGVPPDDFSETGQLWGNPLYRWDRMADDGYRWWARRLARCLSWTPVLRIDHFRAFSAYWAVPATAETALSGEWVQGPGLDLFRAFRATLGAQWLLAEDLGEIDEPVHALRRRSGLLCTRVLQFGFGGGPDNLHLPANVPGDAVVYTGTHDNDTTAGWWGTASPEQRAHLIQALGLSRGDEVVRSLVDAALGSAAHLVIVPAQDLLGLGAEARMNVPGVGEGNWSWRMEPGALTDAVAVDLAERVERLRKR